jgi:SAM-dependent methyltransferase
MSAATAPRPEQVKTPRPERAETPCPEQAAPEQAAPGAAARPTAVYEAVLARPGLELWARGGPDGPRRLMVDRWRNPPDAGDESLLAHCRGTTLDVGCGPGRLTAALAAGGSAVLGIDVAPLAVALTRAAGAPALLRDVFGPLPGAGRWRTALLADGNIGIGGRPDRLLSRVGRLLAPGGSVLVELAPPGTVSGRYLAVLEARSTGRTGGVSGSGGGGARRAPVAVSAPFGWADVSTDDIAPLALRAGLRPTDRWQARDRHFARLERPAGPGPVRGDGRRRRAARTAMMPAATAQTIPSTISRLRP